MNFQYLKYIVTIERSGSISKAAESLYLSQPYLSRVVRELEAQYQISIFTRGKNGIQLTDDGRVFVEMAQGLLNHVELFDQIFTDEQQNNLRLRVSTTPSSHVMDAYIRMLKVLPDSSLRFAYKETPNYEVINDVYTNAADIGVIILTENNRESVKHLLKLRKISYHHIFNMDVELIVRQNHPLLKKTSPLTVDDIYQYNFVMYASQNDVSAQYIGNVYNQTSLDTLLDWNRIRKIIYVYSRSSLHNILTQTDYIALGAKETMDQSEQFHIVSIPFPYTDPKKPSGSDSFLWYLHRTDKELSPMAKEFVSSLMRYYGEET